MLNTKTISLFFVYNYNLLISNHTHFQLKQTAMKVNITFMAVNELK